MWDDYLKNITRPNGPFGKVVVFIDEVDKMKDVESITKFLLILKALYAPMKLFFLVSISEDAYSLFQRRVLSTEKKNEFDSCFDHLERLERMDHEQTRKLLNQKIIGPDLPKNLTLLIWMLSPATPAMSFVLRVTYL